MFVYFFEPTSLDDKNNNSSNHLKKSITNENLQI